MPDNRTSKPRLHDVAWRGRLRRDGGIDEGSANVSQTGNEEDNVVALASKSTWASSNQSQAFSGAISVVQWQEKLIEQELRHELKLKRDRKKAKVRTMSEQVARQGAELHAMMAELEEQRNNRAFAVPFDSSALPHQNADSDDPVVLHNMASSGSAQNPNGFVVQNTHAHEHFHNHQVSALPPPMPEFDEESGLRGCLVNGHGTLSCQLDSTNHLHYHFHGDPRSNWEDEAHPEFHGALNNGELFVEGYDEDTDPSAKTSRTTAHFGGLRLKSLTAGLLNRQSLGYDAAIVKEYGKYDSTNSANVEAVIEEVRSTTSSAENASPQGSRTLTGGFSKQQSTSSKQQSTKPQLVKLSEEENRVWNRRTFVKQASKEKSTKYTQSQSPTQSDISPMQSDIVKGGKVPVGKTKPVVGEFALDFKKIKHGCERHCETSGNRTEKQHAAFGARDQCGIQKRPVAAWPVESQSLWLLNEEELQALPDEELVPTRQRGRMEFPPMKDLSVCGKGKLLRRQIFQGLTVKKLQQFLGR